MFDKSPAFGAGSAPGPIRSGPSIVFPRIEILEAPLHANEIFVSMRSLDRGLNFHTLN